MRNVTDMPNAPTDPRSPHAKFAAAIADYQARSWQGQAIFLAERFADAGQELADWERLRQEGASLPPLAGLTMTAKACFDVEGWPTSCASRALAGSPAATQTAPMVARLRTCGATLVAQTNMTEFAYGALGLNLAFGTPRTPLDATGERVAGGSSSGGAVAVARGYCDIAVCSDTSGSARIPAAFCGVVGFKPSRGRYSSDGMKWLSTSFDVPGLITRSADLCRIVDALLAHGEISEPEPTPFRLAIPAFYKEATIDADVRDTFTRCMNALADEGVEITEIPLPSLQSATRITVEGRIIGYEAYRYHEALLKAAEHLYDPLIATRLRQGAEAPEGEYRRALVELDTCRKQFDREIEGFGAFVLPTVPMMPPRAGDLDEQSRYLAMNSRSFSLTEFANRLDLPSVTLPAGGLPIGMMLTGTRGADDKLLAIAGMLEPVLAKAIRNPL